MSEKLSSTFNKFFKSNAEYKQVGINIIALSLLNGIYFISPLILIPYLIRTVGSEKYGLYIFVWTFIYYFIFIVNYGFDLSTTKEIAINRSDKIKISEIFSNTFYSRIFLFLISFLILVASIIFIKQFNVNTKLILLGLGVILGQTLFPTWIFQGMEEMKFITIVNSIIRILPIGLIFVFVKSASDIDLVILFQSIGFLIGGIFSHSFAIKHFNLTLYKPSYQKIKLNLISSWSLFISTVGVSLYRETNTVILGFLTTNYEIVGFYALADKFIRIVQLIANTFSQALFPFFGRSLTTNKEEAIVKFKKIGIYYSIFLLVSSIGLFVIIPWIVKIYLGDEFPEIVKDVRIMSPVILIGGLNYYLGINGLINLNHKNSFTIFVLIAGLINLILCYFLGRFYYDIGASFSILIAESALLFMIFTYLHYKENIFVKIK